MEEDSILNGTKKALGIPSSQHAFDSELIMYINTAFGTLHQLGIGPIVGYAIEGSEETWDSFIQGDNRFNGVKTYVQQKVRLFFDPPSTSFAIDAMQESLRELEFRLNVVREGTIYGTYVDARFDGGKPESNEKVFDGGTPSESGSIVYDGGSP